MCYRIACIPKGKVAHTVVGVERVKGRLLEGAFSARKDALKTIEDMPNKACPRGYFLAAVIDRSVKIE